MAILSKFEIEQLKTYVIKTLITTYDLEDELARQLTEDSVFAKMLKKNPHFAGHYDVDFWAADIKNSYNKHSKISRKVK